MKHPNRDEWVPYVFGEARADEAKRLGAHLENCAECAAEVAAWRRSLHTLDKWEVPEAVSSRNVVAPVFRWAIAAAIVLAAGIAIGRVTAPDPQAMRAQIEASVKTTLADQMQQSEARALSASQEQANELWQVFSERLAAAREEDWEVVQGLLREQEGRYVNLRRDLETLASLADQEIRAANFKLTQLAGNVP
jgi:anti-sigma factor RsiW